MSTNKKPTILIISQVYSPDPAAVGQYMHDAARALAKRGVAVRVLTSGRGYNDPSVKYPPHECLDGVDVVRLPLSSLGKKTMAHRLIAQSCFLFQAILRGIFTPRLACIIVSTSPPMASIAALGIRFFRRVSIKFWAMDLNPDQLIEMGKLKATSLPARALEMLNKALLRVSDEVIALDRFMGERLQKKQDIREKLTILPPWPLFENRKAVEHSENPFRREQRLEGKFVLMYSGNHGQTTPVKTILEAAVRMQDREELVFMFIGGGVGKRDVEETIEKHHPTNIINLPYQPFDQLRFSLSAADVHLVTMGEKVVGIIHPCKVYDPLALGRPIMLVGPKECHVSDIMKNKQIGWHIEQGDVDGAIAAIDEMRTLDPKELRAMGGRAANVIREQFQPSVMIDQFCEVIMRGLPMTKGVPS